MRADRRIAEILRQVAQMSDGHKTDAVGFAMVATGLVLIMRDRAVEGLAFVQLGLAVLAGRHAVRKLEP